MSRRMSMQEWLARGWYDLQPAIVDGQEVPFEEAPVPLLEHCYQRAHETLLTLAQEAA